MRTGFDNFKAGDTVAVTQKIKEGDNERLQIFTGVVMAIKGKKNPVTFTVRKVSYGIEIEKVYPYDLPALQSVKIKSRGKVARAKLYYLRGRTGKAARIKEL